jgi:hypothetical protein
LKLIPFGYIDWRTTSSFAQFEPRKSTIILFDPKGNASLFAAKFSSKQEANFAMRE